MPWKKEIDLTNEIKQRIGRRTVTRTFEYVCCEQSPARSKAAPFVLVLAYPRNSYLSVRAELGGGKVLQEAGLEGILQRYPINLDAWLGSRGKHALLAVESPGPARIRLQVQINTDDESFCGLAEKALE